MKFNSLGKLVAAVAATFVAAVGLAADTGAITIGWTPGEATSATVRISGITGNQELANSVAAFVKASGWFKLQNSTGADYQLRGAANNTTCEYVLSMGGAEVTRGRVSFNDPRKGAQKIVDAMLQKVFKDQNFKELCQSRIAFCADLTPETREIFICDIAGGSVQQITNFKSFCVEPCWAPDGKSIGYTRYGTGSTAILQTRLNPLGTKQLTNLKGMNMGVAFSPAFNRIAFVGSFENKVELYVQEIGGKSQLRLTDGPGVEASPCWNPAGDTICYVSNEGGRTPRLFTINLAAKSRKRLATLGSEAATPDWSKTNKIVYSAKIDGSYKLAVLDASGDEPPRQVNSEAGEWESPSWAPDGRHVVCARTLGGKTSLYVVDTFDGSARLLLQTKNKLTMPSWSPGAVK